jgi:Fur family ferric uptake transcriptional regulator
MTQAPTCEHSKHNCTFQEHCIAALKNAGMRITRARLAVVECLSSSQKPLSPRLLHEKLTESSAEGDAIDPVSVYRILEILQKLGLIHQVYPSGDYVKCHDRHSPHDAPAILLCKNCGETTEIHIEQSLLDPLMQRAQLREGFLAQEVILQFQGQCRACLAISKK